MSGTELASLWFAFGAVIGIASTARADEPPQPARATDAPATATAAAAAQELFAEGRRLVAERRYAEACGKLEQAERLDPAAGTQLNLADCYERRGKLASAWLAFHQAATTAQRSGRTEWAEQARDRARLLEASVPTLTLVVERPAPGLEVKRDGVSVEPAAFGAPVPVDPGLYTLVAMAPQRRPWSTRVVLGPSARVELHIPTLATETPLPLKDKVSVPLPGAAPLLASPLAPHVGSVQRTIALALGALAVVPIGVGAYFGVLAITRNDQAAVLCPTAPRCGDPQAAMRTADARHAAAASTVAFIAGGTLLATGASLFLTAPRELGGRSIAIGIGGSTVSLFARW